MPGISAGLNLANLNETTQEEIDAYLTTRWYGRGPLYDQYATSLMLDYAPDFMKMHRWLADQSRLLPPRTPDPALVGVVPGPNDTILVATIPQLFSYMMYGWETGIRNEFRVLRRLGLARAEIMEIVLFGRLYTGMRGLGHTYHAIGDVLPDYRDGEVTPAWPTGWAADPAAFKCGLDLSTEDFTSQDRANLTGWYEHTIGYVPRWVRFAMRYDPRVLKAQRALWELAIKRLPKQVAPYLMLRDAQVAADSEAMREAALLAHAWGVTPEWIVNSITYTTMYFGGTRGYGFADAAIGDLLAAWTPDWP
jgi:hypothetical protein